MASSWISCSYIGPFVGIIRLRDNLRCQTVVHNTVNVGDKGEREKINRYFEAAMKGTDRRCLHMPDIGTLSSPVESRENCAGYGSLVKRDMMEKTCCTLCLRAFQLIDRSIDDESMPLNAQNRERTG
ncbi:hypothetical protein WN55_01248 [Dufourea novaeangliae]|uniref:Uncharacterized protein n=1 Tax=Dufourea novaeangliae TaxID=178035 RepID=A0A154NY89_DUFNO|nr:hypothetical protein WN55_01248 [Dufourea novaeangliae]